MSQQCVPSWDLDDDSAPFAPPAQPLLLPHNGRLPFSADYEVAELTWKDGNLALLGPRHPPRIGKPIPRYPSPAAGAAGGTLECIVDQARGAPSSPDLLSWAGGAHHPAAVDALVPCTDHVCERKRARVSGRNCTSQGSATQKKLAVATRKRESKLATTETLDAEGDANESGFSGTHSASPASAGDQADGGGSPETESWSFAGTRSLGVDELDAVSKSLRSQQDALGEIGMTSNSTRRSRVAAIHNQSERKRRDKINQKMKTLQKLLPISNKTDKASMLDEVIDYLKVLQAQVQMMNRMSAISPMMMMPIAMQQHQQQQQQQQLQVSMIAQMARISHMSMGLGMMMDPNMLGRPGYMGMPSPPPPPPPPPPPQQMLHPSAFFPIPAASATRAWDASATGGWDSSATDWMQQSGGRVFPDMFSALMGCPTQQQPTGTEAYNRMAGIYQLLYGYNQKI